MSAAPRVTIGLPVRNGVRYIRDAIDSMLAQTCGDFELVISDNASTDQTESICREYASRDPRIRYVRQPQDIGVVRNFNAVAAQAAAPYFKWASADDLVAPDLLARCLDVLERDDSVVLVHSRTQSIGPAGEPIERRDPGLALVDESPSARLSCLFTTLRFCNAQYGVMRTAALQRTGLFGAFVGSDVCFLAELCLYGRFYELPERLLFRRFHGRASSHLPPRELMQDHGMRPDQLALYFWRHLAHNAAAVSRAPLSAAERLRAWAVIARRAAWQRAELAAELGLVFRHLTGRPYEPLSIGRPAPGSDTDSPS